MSKVVFLFTNRVQIKLIISLTHLLNILHCSYILVAPMDQSGRQSPDIDCPLSKLH